jgi:predicted HTH domain antitoxin
MSERLSVVISKKLKQKLKSLGDRTNLDQSSLIRQLLSEAVQEKVLELAIQSYKSGKISLGKAVELGETDYWTFLDLLYQRHIPLNLDESDVIEEINRVVTGEYKKYLSKNQRNNEN